MGPAKLVLDLLAYALEPRVWTQALDLRLVFRPQPPAFDRRLTMSLDVRNVLTGTDQLFKGTANMEG